MSQLPLSARRARSWASVWVTMALALGAGSLIPWVILELHKEDTEALESPLVLAAAGQLVDGPWWLYGPYGGRNPRVLIHAPLYYRLTALLAWPIVRSGLDPVPAALLMGRMLSTLGFVTALAAAVHLARLNGAARQAGCWAALLASATPVYGGLPFEVRPDMLGIGLQTTGVLLVLATLALECPKAALFWAFACFGLAMCIKQQFVVAPAVSTALLLLAAARGRLGFAPVALSLFIALAIVVLCYGFEEWATGGRMSQSVFVAAASVGRIHPANWYSAGNFVLALVWKSVGLILVLAAAGLAMVLARPNAGRRMLASACTVLIGLIATLVVFQLFVVEMWVSELIVAGLLITMSCLIPACALFHGRRPFDRVDAALWVYCALELAVTAILFRLSTGAWYNYAIQGVLFACVLAARALARAFEGTRSLQALLPAALAVLAVPAFAFTDAKAILAKRRADHASLDRLFKRLDRPSTEIFFVDRPGDNRVHGRFDLVYDPWLYPVFESIGLAEPRSVWLAHALSKGSVRVVVATSPRPGIDGIAHTLPELGYHLSFRTGPFFVWARGPNDPG
jgi:hypothetical protein